MRLDTRRSGGLDQTNGLGDCCNGTPEFHYGRFGITVCASQGQATAYEVQARRGEAEMAASRVAASISVIACSKERTCCWSLSGEPGELPSEEIEAPHLHVTTSMHRLSRRVDAVGLQHEQIASVGRQQQANGIQVTKVFRRPEMPIEELLDAVRLLDVVVGHWCPIQHRRRTHPFIADADALALAAGSGQSYADWREGSPKSMWRSCRVLPDAVTIC
jgi:hypothetical protein